MRGTGFSARSGVVKSLKHHCADPVSHGIVSWTFRCQSKRLHAQLSVQMASRETFGWLPGTKWTHLRCAKRHAALHRRHCGGNGF
jgi:hypothetical protein